MFRAITSMYNVVKAKVRAGGDLTESFMCPSGLKQGEVCSPVLFSLFINELARETVQLGRHGIQLIPDRIEIFILLFAEDVILMSDSVCGLQNQLNILYETANRLGFAVNLDMSNIVWFRNGGHIAWNEKWFYGPSLISVVNVYKYLGICLSTGLTFSHALKDMAARAVLTFWNYFVRLGKNLRFSSNCSMFKFSQFSVMGLKSGVWWPTWKLLKEYTFLH